MDWYWVLILLFGMLIVLFLLGMPVALAFLAIDIVGLVILAGPHSLLLLSTSIFDSVASFTLTPIPLFIFLGEILYNSKAIEVAFDAMDKWVGGIRARLHITTLVFSTFFGAISGAAMAAVAMLGTTVYPEMCRRKYDRKLSLGVILGGASLDPLIPPSIIAVFMASLANVSVAKLLFSGFGPGFLIALLCILFVLLMVWIKPDLAPRYVTKSSFKEKALSLVKLTPFLVIIFLTMGLIFLGVATPTESAATGVIGSLFVSAIFKRFNYAAIHKSIITTIRVSAMIFLIVAGSKAFSQLMAMSGAARGLVGLVNDISPSPLVMLLLMQGIGLFLGCFIDPMSIMMITIPIYLPIIELFRFDPIWFWCIYLINMTLGGITPPFGLTLYVLKASAPDTTLHEIYRAAIPFVIIYVVSMFLIGFFPWIAIWLPNQILK
jgi:tripartite ATP-independent transporter DctM subunit